ncbi:hypothetical protein ACA910_012753 [Epithemia clementina (nom. ined.)]
MDEAHQMNLQQDDMFTRSSNDVTKLFRSASFDSHCSSIVRSPPAEHKADTTAADSSPVVLTSTFDSDADSAESELTDTLDLEANNKIELAKNREIEEEESANRKPAEDAIGSSAMHSSLPFIVVYASFGCIARVFIGRIFGGDCDDGVLTPNDFLAPVLSNICVTNSGLTDQTGGALFTDLPANMIGCFLMGIITHPAELKSPFPWLHPNHSLQKNKAFLDGLTTGLCGCLTTFASWNTQMVRMLDGSYTVLGPQVVASLFGYVIGLAGSFSSFLMGRLAHEWLSSFHNRAVQDMEDKRQLMETRHETREESDTGGMPSEHPSEHPEQMTPTFNRVNFNVEILPWLGLAILIAAFLVGAVVYDMAFYQELVLSSFLAPVGAVLRWKLSNLNSRNGPIPSLHWVPWGTFTANIVASVLSALFCAVPLKYLPGYDAPWLSILLPSMIEGFDGSLSTVSTLVNEMFAMKQGGQAIKYASGSLTIAMLLGLLIFSPIARS